MGQIKGKKTKKFKDSITIFDVGITPTQATRTKKNKVRKYKKMQFLLCKMIDCKYGYLSTRVLVL